MCNAHHVVYKNPWNHQPCCVLYWTVCIVGVHEVVNREREKALKSVYDSSCKVLISNNRLNLTETEQSCSEAHLEDKEW